MRYATEHDVIDRATALSGLRGCDVVVVAVPIARTADCIRAVYETVGASAIVTDVASVKGLLPDIPGARIIGGHPMAGTEYSGITAAKAHLFENAYYVLVDRSSEPGDIAVIERLVVELGARPVRMTAREHDEQAAAVSHMPHMLSFALAQTPDKLSIAGTGFYDMTRIARSDPHFWRTVLSLNRENTLAALGRVKETLDGMTEALKAEEYERLEGYLRAGQAKRIALEEARPPLEEYVLHADIRDEVGALERISGLLAAENINVSSLQIVNSREGVGGALRLGFRTAEDCDRAAAVLERREV